jgi:hypothetical protein
MDARPDATLQRIEALPGSGRYAVTFREANGAEQTAAVSIAGTPAAEDTGALDAADVDVAQASLPTAWRSDGAAFAVLVTAVRAVDAAARFAPPARQLVDVDGGWDVSLGNVVLDAAARPTCTAHGAMTPAADGRPDADAAAWSCTECGARAALHS